MCVPPANLQPTGVVVPVNGKITLSWEAAPQAVSYNVRIADKTNPGARYDDPRFTTCQNSPHYYCEHGIPITSLTQVPVTLGHQYQFWVSPNFSPSRPPCNGYTTFQIQP